MVSQRPLFLSGNGMMVYSLRLTGEQLTIADKIGQQTQEGSITLAVAYIDMETQQLNMIPLNIQG